MSVSNFATSRYLSHATPAVVATPLTMACWFNPGDVTTSATLMSLGNNAATGMFQMSSLGATGGDPISAQTQPDAGGGGSALSTTGYTAGTWFHACAVFASTTSRAAFINGGSKGTNATAGADPTPDFFAIGVLRRSTVTSAQPTTTLIGHPALWNVALTDAEVAQIGAGVHPMMIRPSALVFYSPLIDLSLAEMMNANFLTITGAVATGASEPPVWQVNRRSRLYMPQAGGGGAFDPATFSHPQLILPRRSPISYVPFR